MSKENAFVLLFDLINDTQRAQIQATIEKSGAQWFHQQTNTWIVLGGPDRTVQEWRGMVDAFVRGVPGNVLVLSLPDQAERKISGFAPPTWYNWLQGVYQGVATKASTKSTAIEK